MKTLSYNMQPLNTLARDFATMNTLMNNFLGRQQGAYDYVRNGGSANGKATNGNGHIESLNARLPLDAQANEDAFVFTAYLPGVKPELVEITFENDELTIKGEFPKRDDQNGYIKSELFHGAFERKLSFNTPVNAEAIEANFENGVLTLNVPKSEAAKPKKIAVMAK